MCLQSLPLIQVARPTMPYVTAISYSYLSRNDERDDETCLHRCHL